jgi:hypothetical protein
VIKAFFMPSFLSGTRTSDSVVMMFWHVAVCWGHRHCTTVKA